MQSKTLILSHESKTLLLGSTLAVMCMMGCIIYLYGPVGSGKTTFCKGFLQGLGYTNYIKSPTYTLIESYFLSKIIVHHCDCYRLNSEKELIEIGIQDYLDDCSIFLIEWPKQKVKILPVPDIILTMYYDSYREQYRYVVIKMISKLGKKIINTLWHTKQFIDEIK